MDDTLDDDALFVLTAALLTPGQFPGVLGDDYPAACAGLGLEPLAAGYGLVFGQDGTGARWTVATTDAWMVACALAAWDCGLEYDLSPDENSMAASLPGWPVPVAVSVPGLPEPFDPDEETGGGPALTPPDTAVWGPAQRRLGADEIAIKWREWRDQFDRMDEEDAPAGADADADADTDADADADALKQPAAPSPSAAEAAAPSPVRRVLDAAESYLRSPPPPGRVRVAYGSVRADGPGWSLVGRADDMAFVLLDDVPGEVLPVRPGPALPPLMEALGRLASAPTPVGAA
ncbi:hypothetical protein V2S66_10080 [Streptomyces sp. V4-01]|uniref:Integral membrane protein n=1 Tax=Actinacidiphila polyblastidii TaxID=3110430 RepID=A0ABU7PAM8_9ACTN|nr:hypothetical protein [Streptomyces sp. V4-01]